ncbi:MAG: extracellular solute-binding protein [Anaerolineae bacterium]|nr:extracellular solute-binding protein [Anaerolineae bacterium]
MSLSRPTHAFLIALAGLLALILVACDSLIPAVTQAPQAPTDTPLPAPATPPASATDAPQAPATITLTMWTTETFSPTAVITTGQILAAQVAAFETAHPDVYLDFVLKKRDGKGGMLDYLLTTAAVVPKLLPDVAMVSADDLARLAQADIIQPLDGLLPTDLIADLYPFAVEVATFEGRLVGLQFQANLDHMVYNTGKLTVPPRSWPGVLSNPGHYAFPAGGQSGLVNDAFLTQYLAIHSWAAETAAEPFLDLDSLTAVFQFYQDGVTRGVLAPQILDYHTVDDCLAAFDAGEAILSHVSAHRYLIERERLQSAGVAPIPAINGAGPPITEGWVLVLVTADPARQALAADWMVRLMAPDVVGAWNQAAGYLPTRQLVLTVAGEEDSYARFIHQQMLLARPRPRLANYAQLAAALQRAVEQVVVGETTPEEAATTVMGVQ